MAKVSVRKQYHKLQIKIRKIERQWDRTIDAHEKKKYKIDRKFSAIIDRYDAQLAKLSWKL